jgi:large subunit ribosomal protein L30
MAPANEGGSEAPATLRIKLVRSPIGYDRRQQATVRALGLRRMHQVVEHVDTPAIRGMVEKVKHMVQPVEEA